MAELVIPVIVAVPAVVLLLLLFYCVLLASRALGYLEGYEKGIAMGRLIERALSRRKSE